jgi:hypothetical protein
MGFFNNIKNFKDQALENETIQNMDQLQGIFDKIDEQAEKEKEKKKEEKEYFESLSPEEKVEYKRIQKRNKNLKRLGMYGLTVAGMATGVGVPVLMAANIGTILSDDSLTFDKETHDAKVDLLNKKGKGAQKQPAQKPREYFSISYDKQGLPIVSTLVDRDPYNLQERYRELMRE